MTMRLYGSDRVLLRRRGAFRFLAPIALVTSLQAACSTERDGGFAQPDNGGFNEGVDASVDQPGCSTSTTEVVRVPVVIEFLVDTSGSMVGDKWGAARDALLVTFGDMRALADPATFVGIFLYPNNDNIEPRSMVDEAHYDKTMDSVINKDGAATSTPTAAALTVGYDIVERFEPPPGTGPLTAETRRFVVLVSDGLPTDGTAVCEAIVANAFNKAPPKGPILTFSVGIGQFTGGNGYDPEFMGRIAQKGGTAPAGCDPASRAPTSVCHFQVTPGGDVDAIKQALLDAFNRIRALSASCEFSFTTNPYTDLSNVEVVITDTNGNKTPIPKNDEDGWSFDDPNNPTKVVLRGDACSATAGTLSGRVDVIIGCRIPN